MTRTIGFRRRPIEEYELSDLLAVSSPLEKLWWLLAADAGMRRAEIQKARLSEIHGDRIYIPLGKCGVSRWTIVTSRIIFQLDAAGVTDRICTWHDLSTLDIHFRKCATRARIPKDIVLHCLRHRFATQLLRSGVNLLDIQALLGHADIATTSVYLHADPRRFTFARQSLECATEVMNTSLLSPVPK